MGLISI